MANSNPRARASYPPTLLVTSRNSIITNNRPKSLPSLRATVSTDPPLPNGADGRSVTFARSTVPNISSKPTPASSINIPITAAAPSSASSDTAKQGSQLLILTPFRLPGPTTSNTSTAARLNPSLPHFDKPSSTREFAPPPPSPAPSDKPSVPVVSTSATSTGSAQERSVTRRKTRKPDRYGHKDSVNSSARTRGNRGEGSIAGVLGGIEVNESSDLDELSATSDDSDGEIDQDVPRPRPDSSTLVKAPLVHYKPDFSSCENDIIKIKEMVRQGTGSIPWAIGGGGPYNVYKCKFGTQNGSKGRKIPRCGWMLVRDESESEKGQWIIDEKFSYWYHNHPLAPLIPVPTPAKKRTYSSVSASSEDDEGSPPPAPAPVPTPRGKSNVIWLIDSDDEDVKPAPPIGDRARINHHQKQARVAPASFSSSGNTASSSRAHLSTSTSHQANPQQTTSTDDVSLESFLLSLGLGKHEGENDFMFPLIVDDSETWHTLDHLAPSFRASKTFNTPTRIEKAQIRMLLQSLRTAFESLGEGMIEEGWWKLIGEALGSGLAERRG